MSDITLTRKITVKTVLGERPDVPKHGEYIPLIHIIGIATQARSEESDKGPFTRFRGNFEATNVQSGEVYKSYQMILPEPAQSMIDGALAGSESVQFALEIGVRGDKTSIASYIYEARPLVQLEADPLEEIKKKMLSLPGPRKERAKTEQKATKKSA